MLHVQLKMNSSVSMKQTIFWIAFVLFWIWIISTVGCKNLAVGFAETTWSIIKWAGGIAFLLFLMWMYDSTKSKK